jgi:hypothetical protein
MRLPRPFSRPHRLEDAGTAPIILSEHDRRPTERTTERGDSSRELSKACREISAEPKSNKAIGETIAETNWPSWPHLSREGRLEAGVADRLLANFDRPHGRAEAPRPPEQTRAPPRR